MRGILEDVDAFGLRIRTKHRKQTAILAISADFTLVDGMPPSLALNPNNSNLNVNFFTLTSSMEGMEQEIINISTGTGILTLKNAGGTVLGTIAPGQKALCKVINGVLLAFIESQSNSQSAANKSTLVIPVGLLTGLANAQVWKLAVPFAFTLTSIGFRVGVPVTTAAKAATITAQVNGVAVTGGVISLTSANATPTGTLVAGTGITAGNTGTAGQTIEGAVSAVTAFLEGSGYLEFGVTNTNN